MASSPRTQAASQSTRKRRKPPVASISDQIEIKPPIQEDDNGESFKPANRPTADGQASRSGLSRVGRYDLDHHSFDNGTLRWLPVANGTATGETEVR